MKMDGLNGTAQNGNGFISAEQLKAKSERQVRSDLVSKKLGEKLLQGFRMLNATCDKCDCILMQKKDDPIYCVGCQDPEIARLNSNSNNNNNNKSSTNGAEENKEEAEIQEQEQEQEQSDLSDQFVNELDIIESQEALEQHEQLDRLSVRALPPVSMSNPMLMSTSTRTRPQQQPQQPKQPKQPQQLRSAPAPALQVAPLRASASSVASASASASASVSNGSCYDYGTTSGGGPVDALHSKIEWASGQLTASQNVKQITELCEMIRVASEAVISLRKKGQ
jgi:uncharacterized Zn finger protein (UPF0148 family)